MTYDPVTFHREDEASRSQTNQTHRGLWRGVSLRRWGGQQWADGTDDTAVTSQTLRHLTDSRTITDTVCSSPPCLPVNCHFFHRSWTKVKRLKNKRYSQLFFTLLEKYWRTKLDVRVFNHQREKQIFILLLQFLTSHSSVVFNELQSRFKRLTPLPGNFYGIITSEKIWEESAETPGGCDLWQMTDNNMAACVFLFCAVDLMKRPRPEIYFSYNPTWSIFQRVFEVTLVEYAALLPFMARPLPLLRMPLGDSIMHKKQGIVGCWPRRSM